MGRYIVAITVLLLLLVPGAARATYVFPAFPSLPSFSAPMGIEDPMDGTDRLFVMEREGQIYVIQNDPAVETRTLFLDIANQLTTGGEGGLLGLAFHPQYESNRFFYVVFTATNPQRTVLARFTADATNPNVAVPGTKLVILEVSKNSLFHCGGRISFGPDGYLYMSLGEDGNSALAQSLTSLHGKVLRLDVNNPSGGNQYGIPPGNPFVGVTGLDEIWAYGFRNPWRFSFDPPTGRLWLADVGQNEWEEINIVLKGRNHGWPLMEGKECFQPSSCDTTGEDLVLPLWVYQHNGSASVTGGFVYRGSSLPSMVGKYIYADYITGQVWALTWNGTGQPSNALLTNLDNIPGFGIDRNGEVYIASFDGDIYRLQTGPTPVETPVASRGSLMVSPNPFQSSTRIDFSLAQPGRAVLEVYDVAGRRVSTVMSGHAASGPNTAQWNGRTAGGEQVGSGVYFLRLTVDGEAVETRRITLLK